MENNDSFKEGNLLLFAMNLVSAIVYNLNSSFRTRSPSHFQFHFSDTAHDCTRLLILRFVYNFSIASVNNKHIVAREEGKKGFNLCTSKRQGGNSRVRLYILTIQNWTSMYFDSPL
jgi:hypothetical protein